MHHWRIPVLSLFCKSTMWPLSKCPRFNDRQTVRGLQSTRACHRCYSAAFVNSAWYEGYSPFLPIDWPPHCVGWMWKSWMIPWSLMLSLWHDMGTRNRCRQREQKQLGTYSTSFSKQQKNLKYYWWSEFLGIQVFQNNRKILPSTFKFQTGNPGCLEARQGYLWFGVYELVGSLISNLNGLFQLQSFWSWNNQLIHILFQ